MTPYEPLYRRKCRSPVKWDKVGEKSLPGPKEILFMEGKVHLNREHIRVAQCKQKSYADD